MQNPNKITIVIASLNKGGYRQREQLAPTLKTHTTNPPKTQQIGHKQLPEKSKLFNGTFIIIPTPLQNLTWGTKP
jgi:hypothetical protein